MRIRLSRANVGLAECEAVRRVLLEDGYLGMGKEVQEFEADIAAYLGVPKDWVICVNSGTAALHLAVEAITQAGDEVLVQSLTFVASFQAIRAAGAVPVACEVLPESVTLDLADAARRLSNRTRAVMPVHYAGNPGDLEAIYAFADQHGLRVVEDAAHAFGGRYRQRLIGSCGDIVCFSFDGIKNITSGEGGAVVTADAQVAQRVRDGRLLGVMKDTEKRFSGQRSWNFEVHRTGYRYHLSNIMAAIGKVQLQRLASEFAPKRQALVRCYQEALASVSGVRLLVTDLTAIIPHIMPIRILEGQRDGLREYLGSQGIETGIHYKPNHFLSLFGGGQERLPVTESLYEELLSLPLHPLLTEDEVYWICKQIKSILSGSKGGI